MNLKAGKMSVVTCPDETSHHLDADSCFLPVKCQNNITVHQRRVRISLAFTS